MGSVRDRVARERVGARIRELADTPRHDARAFIEALRLERERPIIVEAVDMEIIRPGLWGLYAADEYADYILFERDTDPDHQEHIIWHEVGHLVMGHRPSSLHRLGPKLIAKALGRDRYTRREELEAELFATLMREGTIDVLEDTDLVIDPAWEVVRHRLGAALENELA